MAVESLFVMALRKEKQFFPPMFEPSCERHHELEMVKINNSSYFIANIISSEELAIQTEERKLHLKPTKFRGANGRREEILFCLLRSS
jgi:hypothetical protein